MSDFKTPNLVRPSFLELGDTGNIDVRRVLNGVEFVIREGQQPRASIVITPEETHGLIAYLCQQLGIPFQQGPKLGGPR